VTRLVGPERAAAAPPSLNDAVSTFLAEAADVAADELEDVVTLAGRVLGASSARLLIADYALVSLRPLGGDGPTGSPQLIEGTLAGRAFIDGSVVTSGTGHTTVWAPLVEGSERIGVVELVHDEWTDAVAAMLGPVVQVLVLILISRRRYTDVVVRSRRSERLSAAAEMQWDLLPPLTCSTANVSVSGILEPAYSIGGDSFDFALNADALGFAIADAVGHGTLAVLLSVTAMTSLRNARREGLPLEEAYLETGAALEAHFGDSRYVTAQLGELSYARGDLTWLNAGHPLPLLVRDRNYVGELVCPPSLPMGIGGTVRAVATEHLQPGDRVLFYTDGVTETRDAAGRAFGLPRLADLLLRATLDEVSPAETVRRLSSSILAYNGSVLSDDATLMLIEYHGPGGHA
jgi:hypothetical protein